MQGFEGRKGTLLEEGKPKGCSPVREGGCGRKSTFPIRGVVPGGGRGGLGSFPR